MRKQIVTAALVGAALIAAVWTCVCLRRRAKEQEEIDRVVWMVQKFKSDIETVVKDEHADAATVQAAIDRIENETEKWKDRSTESEIMQTRARLIDRWEKFRITKEYWDKFNRCKEAVENPGSRTTYELIQTKSILGEININSETYDPGHPQTIKDWKVAIDHLLVGKMRGEAKAFAAQSSTTPHQGLAKYAEAEDYVYGALVAAKKAKNRADEAEFTATYKALLAESDAYAAKVVTPEFVASIPWKDLLSGEMAARWSKSKNVPGFACRIENGVLTISPPDPGDELLGVAGIFDQKTDDLRFFDLDMEFAVEGTVTMFFHVAPSPATPDSRQSHSFDLVAGENRLKAGRKYTMETLYVGSVLAIYFQSDSLDPEAWRADPSWTKLRSGGIAFLVPEGARLKITRMRIKELR